jgi:hypothetical protein
MVMTHPVMLSTGRKLLVLLVVVVVLLMCGR